MAESDARQADARVQIGDVLRQVGVRRQTQRAAQARELLFRRVADHRQRMRQDHCVERAVVQLQFLDAPQRVR